MSENPASFVQPSRDIAVISIPEESNNRKTLGINKSIITINHRILDILTKTGKQLDFLNIDR